MHWRAEIAKERGCDGAPSRRACATWNDDFITSGLNKRAREREGFISTPRPRLISLTLSLSLSVRLSVSISLSAQAPPLPLARTTALPPLYPSRILKPCLDVHFFANRQHLAPSFFFVPGRSSIGTPGSVLVLVFIPPRTTPFCGRWTYVFRRTDSWWKPCGRVCGGIRRSARRLAARMDCSRTLISTPRRREVSNTYRG